MIKVPSSTLQQCLCPITMLFVEVYSEAGIFRHLSNPLFRKYIAYDGHLFFENAQNLMFILEMPSKIEKNNFLSEIIVSELVAINCLY